MVETIPATLLSGRTDPAAGTLACLPESGRSLARLCHSLLIGPWPFCAGLDLAIGFVKGQFRKVLAPTLTTK
jgi:hypothetical protein